MLSYPTDQPTRAEVDALDSPTALVFGTDWCGYCRAADRHITAALADQPHVRLIGVEDGKGRPLGRSFGVKFWPTVIVLDAGREVARVVRPMSRRQVDEALARLGRPDADAEN